MKLRCRLRWHNWKQWQTTPAINGNPAEVVAGQLRQCSDCWRVQAETFAGTSFNLRPLRMSVRAHVEDLRRCVQVIRESQWSKELEGTANEIAVATNELQSALAQDEGRPK